MDHDSVREALELAAVEPGGLDRLMAGDTPTAMAVAGHLAGCPSCTLELDRIRRVSEVVRDVVGSTPSPELRDRTLAHVRAHGIPRGPAVAQPPISQIPVASTAPAASTGGRRRGALGWVAAVAAAVVLSVVATSIIIDSRFDQRLAAQDRAIEDLASVTTATLHVTSEPDVARVGLDSPAGDATSGTLLYSPSTTELVVVANGLTEPADGMEYHCWVLVDGKRQGIGKMFFGGGLAYWVGPSPAVAALAGGETFGVSLVDADGAIVGSDPVLTSGA
jgi:Anti-sigma-K factor rskA